MFNILLKRPHEVWSWLKNGLLKWIQHEFRNSFLLAVHNFWMMPKLLLLWPNLSETGNPSFSPPQNKSEFEQVAFKERRKSFDLSIIHFSHATQAFFKLHAWVYDSIFQWVVDFQSGSSSVSENFKSIFLPCSMMNCLLDREHRPGIQLSVIFAKLGLVFREINKSKEKLGHEKTKPKSVFVLDFCPALSQTA